jgi:hypothetical protein
MTTIEQPMTGDHSTADEVGRRPGLKAVALALGVVAVLMYVSIMVKIVTVGP